MVKRIVIATPASPAITPSTSKTKATPATCICSTRSPVKRRRRLYSLNVIILRVDANVDSAWLKVIRHGYFQPGGIYGKEKSKPASHDRRTSRDLRTRLFFRHRKPAARGCSGTRWH